jgi:hypothetical protein
MADPSTQRPARSRRERRTTLHRPARAQIRTDDPTYTGDRTVAGDEPRVDDPAVAGDPALAAGPAAGAARRDDIRFAAGLLVLAGIWLIIAPFVLGYGSGDPYWNDIVFGAIVGVLGLLRLALPAQAWTGPVSMLIGAWIFAAAFWLDNTSTAAWNDVILGVIVFVLGAIASSTWRGRRPAASSGV